MMRALFLDPEGTKYKYNQHEPLCRLLKESKEPPHYWTFFCLMFKCNANRLWLYINILEKKGLSLCLK